jgi:hypothetical protein
MEQSATNPGAAGLPTPCVAAQQHFWLFHGPLYQNSLMDDVCNGPVFIQ